MCGERGNFENPEVTFIESGAEDCPLVRISGTDFITSRELFHSIRNMRVKMAGAFAIHELPGFEMCQIPELTFEFGSRDLGVISTAKNKFVCSLSYDGWIQVEDLLAPFCLRSDTSNGYQWLNESSEIALLYSPSGCW